MKKLTAFAIAVTAILTSCAPIVPETGISTPIVITAEASTVIAEPMGTPGTEVPFPTPEPSTAIPTLPSSSMSPTELKYAVLDQFPDFFFCDPDYYPISREDEMVLARQRFPELQANQEEFQAILNHNKLGGIAAFTDDQKLLIYREHKKLNAVYFELVGDEFQFQIQTGSEGQQGLIIKGTIDGNGSIDVQQRDQGFPTCPICLAQRTLIDTPRGTVPVEKLKVGDSVWTANEAGERVAGVVLRVGSVEVPVAHEMVHIILSDGRELQGSPGHPTADGRTLAELNVGDRLDGARVTLVMRLPYDGNSTYDLLPSGSTGFYWANGILMGTTMNQP